MTSFWFSIKSDAWPSNKDLISYAKIFSVFFKIYRLLKKTLASIWSSRSPASQTLDFYMTIRFYRSPNYSIFKNLLYQTFRSLAKEFDMRHHDIERSKSDLWTSIQSFKCCQRTRFWKSGCEGGQTFGTYPSQALTQISESPKKVSKVIKTRLWTGLKNLTF
jgi:hypothetical protein